VNGPSDRLRLCNIQGIPAVNPANGNVCSIIDADLQQIAEQIPLTTWDQTGYLVLSFAADLRASSACLLHHHLVHDQLQDLGLAFPGLVKAVQEKVSIEQITRVLRALIAEEISIRNLRLILEQILDYDYIVTDPSKYIIFDDRLPTYTQPDQVWLNEPMNLTSFVRSGLKRYISHKYTRGQNTLVVYLLHPDIERILSEHQQQRTCLAEVIHDQILEAVRREVDALSMATSSPAILTTIDVRPIVRDLIAPELPQLPVLSYQELSPDINIQPIARIALNA
jgi:type III secretion protein V